MWMALLLVACSGDDASDTTPTADTALVDLTVEDVFVQTLITPVDILWVIDGNWGEGMSALDGALESGFDVLLLADPAWRMGVMNADVSSNQTRGLITKVFETWPPPNGAFNINSSGPPKVREALYTAFDERLERNEDFLRPEADLFVLVFTDREDQTEDSVISDVDFVTWLDELELSQTKRISALTSPDAGPAWRQLANSTGGAVYEAGAFKKGVETLILEAIGQEKEFRLSEIPAAPPEEVIVVFRERGTAYARGEDFEYYPDSNSIVFDKVIPPPNSQIRITYEKFVEGGTPGTTEPTTTTGSR